MIELCSLNDCTGCSACYVSCASHAIKMERDKEGFLYPKVSEEKCKSCGACRKACPVINVKKNSEPESYLAWIKDSVVRQNSTSGGLFSAIATDVLRRGGVVCGASYRKDMTVAHIIVDKVRDLPLLRGSKYVQSEMGSVFLDIKKCLQDQRIVYFVGTPCQVNGLKNYLRGDFPNLITSDIICHGVPSAYLFKKQVSEWERSVGFSIADVKFRSKKRFGQGYDLELIGHNGRTVFKCIDVQPYFRGFWNNQTLRESCYNCKYASVERTGDVTLGDFWLVKKFYPKVKTSQGVSLIFANTDKGKDVLNRINSDIFLRKCPIEHALCGQEHLKVPVSRPDARNAYKSYEDWDSLCSDLLKPSLSFKLKKYIRNFIKTVILYGIWK